MMVTRNPLMEDFVNLRETVDRLFNETSPFRGLWTGAVANGTRAGLPLDVYVTDREAVILAAVPGVDPANIEITVNQGTVTISGEIPNAAASEDAKGASWYLHELPTGTFRRSLSIPVEFDVAKAEANFAHGMLRLTLPKSEQAKPRQIKINVTGAPSIDAADASGEDK
jgi:HSP20 family protein